MLPYRGYLGMSLLKPPGAVRVLVGLGSNLGNREGWLAAALAKLAEAPLTLGKSSALYQTEPVGPPQGPYLNMVQEVFTQLGPEELLALLIRIESDLGRERKERWGARNIDLDLLFYGTEIIDSPGLKVPHPELHRRGFVLIPLAEIAPEQIHPVLGLSVAELAARLGATGVSRW